MAQRGFSCRCLRTLPGNFEHICTSSTVLAVLKSWDVGAAADGARHEAKGQDNGPGEGIRARIYTNPPELNPTPPPVPKSHQASMASQNQQTASGAVAGKLWGGRFTGDTDPLMVAYNESIYFDRAFYAQDIAGSIAFARANVTTGILTKDEFGTIETGLRKVLEEWRTGVFKIVPGIDEDIHTANERRLGEIIGKDIAGKLHT
ncbi:conserved hypothetical protein [Histoplasma capsulatum H143]|uniref:Fumarate lyase N-terminal domain-containing protein n=1 Tax=Ajellomyces capsulatus (strain H143) TaxID=544712 RepID=C6H8J2_AJECH|nr:conserved hypothetical protein [Histoplasma capsulatum H143]